MSFTTRTVQYIPFRETSFGFGSGAVAAAQTQLNPTDIVRVDIKTISGSNFSDLRDGHISTPSVGTAISVFNGYNNIWTVRGELADVDAVLAQLSYFPSDYETTRIWTPTPLKDNQTSGVYLPTTGTGGEEPPAIPDDDFQINIYDSNNQSLQSSNVITFEAHQYDYGNSRPYWSVEPTNQDCYYLGTPPRIDLGTINNSTDENVTVTCEFRNYNSSSPHTGTAYGSFTQQNRFYVGDKIEGTRNTDDARFNFTGSVAETQVFLDNIAYRKSSPITFDMFLTITDGVVGSTTTKTCWFSNSPFTSNTTFPDQAGTEEQSLVLNMPSLSMTRPVEVNEFRYIITLDATGTDGVVSTSVGTLAGSVITGSYYTSVSQMRTVLDNTILSFRDDFNDDFTFTITYEARNTTVGSSYSTSPETVNVTMAGTSEINNLFTAHSFTEDTRYRFSDGAGLPSIAHGYNVNYEARIFASDANAIDVIWTQATGYTHGTDFFYENGNQLRMVGTRNEVNEMLSGVYFEPSIDYDQNFTFGYRQKRTGGDTTSDASNGDYYNIDVGVNNCISMTAIPHDEYSFTASTKYRSEDVSKIFDTGIRVTDLSDEHEWTPSYQTTYTVSLKTVDASGNDFTDGYLIPSAGGTGGSPEWTLTGTKTEINTALASMKYVPIPDGTDNFLIQFRIVRDFDSAVLVDYSDTRQITFTTAGSHDEYSFTQTNVNWAEDTLVSYDSGLQITDLADENIDLPTYQSDYEVEVRGEYWDGNNWQTLVDVAQFSTSNTNVTKSGLGTVASPLIITGSKTDVNNALDSMLMIPNPDVTQSPNVAFASRYKITRVSDSSNVGFPNFNVITNFSTATAQQQYAWADDGSIRIWNMNEFYDFDTQIEITDTADTVVGGLAENANYRISARSKYNSDSSDFDLGTFTSTNIGSATMTGDGTVSNALTITGSKTDVNTALDNFRFIPSVDADPTSTFRLEFKIERISYPNTFLNYGNSMSFTDTPIDNRFSLTRATTQWTEEVAQDFDTGLQINEIVTEEQTAYPTSYDTEYKVEIQPMTSDGLTLTDQCRFSQSAAMSLLPLNNITGNDTNQFAFEGKKADINSALDSVTFTPNPDETDPIYVAYKITRLFDSSVVWDFSVSSTVDFGTATNTTEYYEGYIAHSFNIGSLTGNVHTLLNGLDVGITDTAEDVTSNVTYEVTLEIGDRVGVAPYTINSSVNDFVQFNANPYVERDYFDIIDYVENNTVVIAGTKSQVNSAIQNLEFYVDLDYPHDNSNSGYDPELMYTQKRFINGILDTTHVERELKTRFDWD